MKVRLIIIAMLLCQTALAQLSIKGDVVPVQKTDVEHIMQKGARKLAGSNISSTRAGVWDVRVLGTARLYKETIGNVSEFFVEVHTTNSTVSNAVRVSLGEDTDSAIASLNDLKNIAEQEPGTEVEIESKGQSIILTATRSIGIYSKINPDKHGSTSVVAMRYANATHEETARLDVPTIEQFIEKLNKYNKK